MQQSSVGCLEALLSRSAFADTHSILIVSVQSVSKRTTEVTIFVAHQNYFCYKFVDIVWLYFLSFR